MKDDFVDFVIYCDTDSNFYSIEKFIEHHVGLEKWNQLDDDEKIELCREIGNLVSQYVNEKSYKQVQQKDFNSTRKDFRIEFKQEIIARTGLFVAKKKYGLGIVDKEGERKEELFVKGLEIIQSATPRAIKPRLTNMMAMIISGKSDDEIAATIRKDKKEIMKVLPEEIAVNIGANNLDKYIKNGKAIKGTPGHIKGINNYHILLKKLGIEDKYKKLGGVGEKIKLVYTIMPNQYNIEVVGFNQWPDEFGTAGIKVDYNMMIDKYYMNKIEMLLDPVNKSMLIKGGNIDSFFI
jgi:hypothetical protein